MFKLKTLQISSLLYIFPSVLSLQYGILLFQWIMPLILLTSIINHGYPLVTNGIHSCLKHKIIRYIDISLVHFIVAYHIFICLIGSNPFSIESIMIYTSSAYGFVIFYLDLPRNDLLHSTLHFTSSMSSFFMLYIQHCNNKNKIK